MNLIVQEGKYYLYRHIRLDKNEVFYIGIGTKKKYGRHEHLHRRAYATDSRNKYWTNVINKTEYRVEILLESDDLDFIKQKEVEFISLYGRKNLGKGTLVNLTDGGEGNHGLVVSEETRKKMSASLKGRVFTKEWIRKFSEANKGKTVSDKTRKLLSEKLSGKKRTPEQKQRMKEAQSKRDWSTEDFSKWSRGEKSGASKLTDSDVLEIKEMLINDVPYKEMMKRFGIKSNTITAIQKGISWSHLTGFSRATSYDKRQGYGERSKLKPEDVLEIKSLLEEGLLSIKDIAKQFCLGKTVVTNIYKGNIWSSVTGFSKENTVDRRLNVRNLAKLTSEQVGEIKSLLREKTVHKKEIAKQYNISHSTIKKISCGKIWKDIN